MVKLVARSEDGHTALIVVLTDIDVARLYEPEPLAFDVGAIAPEWPETWCFISGGTPDRAAVERFCALRGDIDNALMIGIDEAGLAKIKADQPVTYTLAAFGAPPEWKGEIIVGYERTHHDALERYARNIGPTTEVHVDQGAL